MIKATSYKDLIKNFQQAQQVTTQREKKVSSKPLQLKKSVHHNK